MKRNTVMALALSTALALGLAGCNNTQSVPAATKTAESTSADTANNVKAMYPVTLGETEILMGETKLQALYDAGYTIEAPVDPQEGTTTDGEYGALAGDQEIAAKQSIQNCYVMKDGAKQAEVDVLGGQSKGPLSDAVITGFLRDQSMTDSTESIAFADIDLADLTMEAFVEAVDGDVTQYGTTVAVYQQGDWNMDVQWDESGELASIRVSVE